MERYNGKWLGARPHIAVIGSCKIGNFVVTIPLLEGLREKYPEATIDFWGSELTKDFENHLCNYKYRNKTRLLDWRHSWDEEGDDKLRRIYEASKERGKIDYLVNCDGFNPMTQVLAHLLNPNMVTGGVLEKKGRELMQWGTEAEQRILSEDDWDSREFLQRNGNIIKTQYIAELFCRMSYIIPEENHITNIELPSIKPDFEIPDVLIHCSTTRDAKLWEGEKWVEVINWCGQNNISVGIIGAKQTNKNHKDKGFETEEMILNRFGQGGDKNVDISDLRGKTSLIELAGACKEAKAVISVDAGPMHIATAVGSNVMVIVGNDIDGIGASPIRLWLPRAKNLTRTVSDENCDMCSDNRFKNNGCLKEKKVCMMGVSSKDVISWMKNIFST